MTVKACVFDINSARRELQPHGTPEFPCAVYETRYTNAPGGDLCWHWHEDMEIWHVLEGRMELRLPGRTLLLRAGDCAAINANTLHAGETDAVCRLRALVFSPALVAGERESVFFKRYLQPLLACKPFDAHRFDPEEAGEARAAFSRAFAQMAAEEPGYEFAVREAVSRLCLLLCGRFASLEGEEPAGQDGTRLRAMLEYIHAGFAQPIALKQIASAANIGERECLRCFQRTVRLSPMQYLLKYRVTRGAEMLRANPGFSVSQIAAACGFDSPSNFSKMFRRFYGLSPREYRQRGA